ncbi:hypothetical protein D9Q98_007360 [Chlorella vulgaris]|uniref:VOC domain-containing protein n=1 Tax=Chlorella vulgaris TaxID=3077 RepID=A0A9D4TL68_CHLVU|nr:hypothetical protein D9Q98_007360 [Chlorella vulgaris]
MRSSTAATGAGSGDLAAATAPATSEAAAQPPQLAAGEASAQDVGDVVHLEHVNLEVPDLDLARVFYGEGLGLTPDPDSLGWQRGGPFVTWYNVGRQQFHICKGPTQTTGGIITLKLPSVARVADQLKRLEPVLQGTAFTFSPLQPASGGAGGNGSSLAVTCPWGQRFMLVDAASGFTWAAGIVQLQLPCFKGTAHSIARFYSETLGAGVAECGSSGGGDAARVVLGPGTSLCFEEDAALGELKTEAVDKLWSGWHVAFYISRFSSSFSKVSQLGINQLDHPYRDKSPGLAEALANRQFRFKDVVRLDSFGKRGATLFKLGHEPENGWSLTNARLDRATDPPSGASSARRSAWTAGRLKMPHTNTIFCLDASACCLLSEDIGPGTTRFHFQRELISCQSKACLAGNGGERRHPAATASSQQAQKQQVLITASGGKATVAMHPSVEAAALQQALAQVQPSGEANLAASLKLALLVSRRFPAGSTHVTAFVGSPGATASLTAEHPTAAAVDLRQRFQAAGVGLDVAVLGELHSGAAAALEALTGSSSSGPGIATTLESSTSSEESSASTSCGVGIRLVLLAPVAAAVESWQQLEPALEVLEARYSIQSGSSDNGEAGGGSSSSSGSGNGAVQVQAVLRRIGRGPRQFDPLQHPRTPLLAMRSGVQQPALCRGESLNRLGHLSSDGMARPWLPTYSSIAQQAAAAAGGGGGATGGGASAEAGGLVFVEVQPIPKWRTLLRFAAGRMDAAPAVPDLSAAGGGGGGDFAAASSQLLRSLEDLQGLEDVAEESSTCGTASSTTSISGSGLSSGVSSRRVSGGSDSSEAQPPQQPAAAAVAAAPAPVRYAPDERRGTLRLLQATKEPELLKLVWSADRGAEGDAQAPPLDMFGEGGASSSASGSASHAALLSFMPAATVAASAARGPLVVEGCELWEAAAEWEWEMALPAAAGGSGGGDIAAAAAAARSADASTAPLACFQARQLPNGAQVLLVAPTAKLQRRRRPATAAAFWLQQQVAAGSLQPPAYATGSGTTEVLGSPIPAAVGSLHEAAGSTVDEPPPQQQEAAALDGFGEQTAAPLQHQRGSAALLAEALANLMRDPPAVDLRRLRRDVKAGIIQVSPITLGPLPAQFVRDIVATRAAIMGTAGGTENLDSWDEGSGSGTASSISTKAGTTNGSASAGRSSSSEAASGVGLRAGSSEAPAAAAKGEDRDSDSVAAAAAAAAASMRRRHKPEIFSLLAQRLQRARGVSSSGGKPGEVACQEQKQERPAAPSLLCAPVVAAGPAEAEAGSAGQAPGLPAAASDPGAVPCSPLPAPAPASCGSSEAGTPFGTPLEFLPSSLIRQRTDGAASEEGASSALGATANCDSLGGEGAGKHEHGRGPVDLLRAASRQDNGDSEPPMFQLE